MKILPAVLAALLIASVLVLARVDARRMPQVVAGDDALSVAFGDAKAVISRAMIAKADSYFHGGVGHCSEEHDESVVQGCFADPWRWINARIGAPRIHRHLQGRESVEMIPWLWASVRADPHNESAWEQAWYTASHVMGDRALALRILDEGLSLNPRSARLYLTKGGFLYKMHRGDLENAERCFRRAVEYSAADSQIREFANGYLKDMERQREGK